MVAVTGAIGSTRHCPDITRPMRDMLVGSIGDIKPVVDSDAKLLGHGERLHYRIEERSRIRGRSGVNTILIA